MGDNAHVAGGPAPTSSSQLDEISELCVRFMQLCLNTKKEQRAMPRAAMPFYVQPVAQGHIQHHCPRLGKKRKHCSVTLLNGGNQMDNSIGKEQDEFTPSAKKRRTDSPKLPAPLHAKSLFSSNLNGNQKKQAQPSCPQPPSLAAQQHKIQESYKTDGSNQRNFQPDPVEGQKPSGKRKCKTKHLCVQGRKRSFFAMDDPFDIEDSQDMAAPPKKVMKEAEPALHHGSLPTKF